MGEFTLHFHPTEQIFSIWMTSVAVQLGQYQVLRPKTLPFHQAYDGQKLIAALSGLLAPLTTRITNIKTD